MISKIQAKSNTNRIMIKCTQKKKLKNIKAKNIIFKN
jgi:hypothetical protein